MTKQTDNIYVWIRWRKNSSAHAGSWSWREWAFPAVCDNKRKQMAYFKKHYGESLADENNSGSEHYRGVEWDFAPIPQEILRKKREGLKSQREGLKVSISRLAEQIMQAPVQVPNPKKKCGNFPACGCIKEFKTKDCRAPYQWIQSRTP